MLQRILVPLDGSSRAENALPVAVRIAQAQHGSIHLVRVVNPLPYYGMGLAPTSSLNEEVVESMVDEATRYLRAIASSQMFTDIPITTDVMAGLTVQHILAAVETQKCDIIVLCSHGRTGFTRWMLGSVAYQLVHQSTIPLLVLREHDISRRLIPTDPTRALRALVPLDGSERSEAALLPAAQLVAALSTTTPGALHLAQVVRRFPEMVGEKFVDTWNETALQTGKTYLKDVAERFQTEIQGTHLSVTWAASLEQQDVASTLLHMTESGDQEQNTGDKAGYDLIALSTHGRSGLDRWVIGSVTERLLNATKLPMFIVRPIYGKHVY